jgi:hypothetical protein
MQRKGSLKPRIVARVLIIVKRPLGRIAEYTALPPRCDLGLAQTSRPQVGDLAIRISPDNRLQIH